MKDDRITVIQKQLPETELLAQLAEEAAELAQAALKLRRVYDGRNKTPVTNMQAVNAFIEEIADVQLCIEILNYSNENVQAAISKIKEQKLSRWVKRLEI